MKVKEILFSQTNNDNKGVYCGEKWISYTQLSKESEELNLKLSEIITYVHNVLICLPNSINFIKAYFAVQFSDKIVMPLVFDVKKLEFMNTLRYGEIFLVIANNENIERLASYAKDFEYKLCFYNIDTEELEFINTDKSIIAVSNYIKNVGDDGDVAVLLHTSGTTSNPKRVMLTHKNIISNILSNIESLTFNSEETTLIAMPMFFGYSHTAQLLTHIYLGANIVIYDGIFLAKKFFELVEKYKITNFTGVPSMLFILLNYKYYYLHNVLSLKTICFGGGFMPVDKLRSLMKQYNTINFIQTYGQTEASPRISALLPKDSIRKLGSVGKPIPRVEVRIDGNGKQCKNGTVGEIIVRGENVMKGYYKCPNETQNVIKNGWLFTGDLGYIDDEGFLYLVGRKKNIIISGGINIYPEEIEEILLMLDFVKEVFVYAEPDEFYGEVPVADIVPSVNGVSEQNILEFCEERLVKYKVPKHINFVSSLNKTYNGKILRKTGEQND